MEKSATKEVATPSEPPQLPSWIARQLPGRRGYTVTTPWPIHWLAVGPKAGEGPLVLLLHGNPTWSFLWREVLRGLEAAGIAAVAPDLVGFGLSGKPRRIAEHTLANHVAWLDAWLAEVAPARPLVIVGQDWGGPIGAVWAARHLERVVGAVFANTAILRPREPLRTTAFHRLSHLPVVSELLFVGLGFPLPVLQRVQGDPRSLPRAVRRAYWWPLRRPWDRIAPLALARMVPDRPSHPSLPLLEESDAWARSFRGPVGLVWGRRDPILGRALRRMREAFPGAEVTETDAGHFLQEEVPQALVEAILRVLGSLETA